MSNSLQGEVWKTVHLESTAEMLLLVAYADIANDEGTGIFASEEYMQHKTGIAARTIQAIRKKWRNMGVLVPIGFIHLESRQEILCDVNVRRGAGGRGWAALYRLCLDPLPKKAIWKSQRSQKVAIAATFNTGIGDPKNHEKVAMDATLQEGQKVAMDAQEGRNGAQQKVAMDAQEGRKNVQRNKEDPLDRTQGLSMSGNLRPALSQSERDSWDLRRYREARKQMTPPEGDSYHFLSGEEKIRAELELDRHAAFIAGISIERLQELLRPFFPDDPYIDKLKISAPLFEGEASA